MTYEQIKKRALTGDVLAVKGNGFASKIIRTFTGESYSHVALLVKENHGLMAYEFVEGVGFQILPASEWVRRRKNQNLRYCVAPSEVSSLAVLVESAAKSYRNSSVASRLYGWFSLVKVFISQKIGLKIKVRKKVCSTFVQECWATARFELSKTADPGEIVNACDPIHKIEV